MADWQNRLTEHFERQEQRANLLDEADKVSPCDGQDPAAVKLFLRELELLALEHRVLIFNKAARGSMLRTGIRWLHDNQNPDWQAFKTHLLQSFVSADANNARRADLQRCTRQPGESLLSFNRRFSELGDDAYPGARNAEQVELLVRLYATGLKDRQLAEKIIKPHKPDTLEQALQRVAATEEVNDNMVWLGYEPMEVDAFTPARTTPRRSDSADRERDVQAELHVLRTQYGKLEAKLDRLLENNMSTPAGRPAYNHPRQAVAPTPRRTDRQYQDVRPALVCFYCGQAGHVVRECRARHAEAEPPAQLPAQQRPATARATTARPTAASTTTTLPSA